MAPSIMIALLLCILEAELLFFRAKSEFVPFVMPILTIIHRTT